MTFTDITELRTYINDTFTANGIRNITGPEAHDALIGMLDLLAPQLLAQLTVQLGVGGSVGGTSTGQVFTQGTKIEDVIRTILIKGLPPSYVQPSVTLTSSVATTDQEIGSIISPLLTVIFTQGDAGALSSRSLKRNASQISTASPYTDGSLSLAATTTYQATVGYGQGACKNNNLGVLDCGGRIQAGSVNTNSITYNAFRKAFFGTPTVVPTTSTHIRGLSGSLLHPINGTQFTINIPIGSQRVCFAYPATLQDVTSVQYAEFANTDIKAAFTASTINVEGANSYAAASYKVYIFEPVEPFTTNATYIVTI